jgi:8-oxo-dGTP diphosphatase
MDYVDPFGRPVFGVMARCAIVKDGKMLLIREKMENTWETPGGGVEAGENLEQAVRREALEETGHEVTVGRPLSASMGDTRRVKGLKKVCIMFEAELGKKVGEPQGDINGLKWFTRDELKKLTPDWHDREAFKFALEKMRKG